MKHKFWLTTLVLSLLLLAAPAYAYGPFHPSVSTGMLEKNIPLTVHVDGKYVSTDVMPFAQNGRTYLPLRAASEAMGASVRWDGASQTATITKNGTVVKCTVGSARLLVNGRTHWMDVTPLARSNRILLPIRPIANALNASIEWDGSTASVDIYTGAPVQPRPQLPSDIPHNLRWLVEKYYVAPTAPGVGSWYTNEFSTGYFEQKYVFISKMSNGTTNAIMLSAQPDAQRPICTVGLCGIGARENRYTLEPFKHFDSMYYFGPATGIIGDYYYHYCYDSSNNLILTGSTFNLGGQSDYKAFNKYYMPIG